jgi:hypothetical protein
MKKRRAKEIFRIALFSNFFKCIGGNLSKLLLSYDVHIISHFLLFLLLICQYPGFPAHYPKILKESVDLILFL